MIVDEFVVLVSKISVQQTKGIIDIWLDHCDDSRYGSQPRGVSRFDSDNRLKAHHLSKLQVDVLEEDLLSLSLCPIASCSVQVAPLKRYLFAE